MSQTLEERVQALENQWTNQPGLKKGIATWGWAILGYLTILIPIAVLIAVLTAIM